MTLVPRRGRFNRAEQSSVLAAIVDRVHQMRGGARPVVVLDLDSTLLDNRPRTLAIFGELADRWRGQHPELARTLQQVRIDELPYLVDELLSRLVASHPGLVSEARRHWAEAFFSDRFLQHDRPYPGAVEFTRLCHRAGATLVYFTARDSENMGVGTVRSLRDHGFPFAVPRVELVMKPRAETSDANFKDSAASGISEIGRVVAAFDNEPHHCNTLIATHPEAVVVLMDTQHDPSAPVLDGSVLVLGGFELEEPAS